jgi:hypothetical protein
MDNKEHKVLKFAGLSDTELTDFIQLLKKWLLNYSNIKLENLSNNSLTTLIHEKENFSLIINPKNNFARVKIYIDYLEMSTICPGMTSAMQHNFVKFSRFVQNSIKKILVALNKFQKDSIVFIDLVLLNYAFCFTEINMENLDKLMKTNRQLGGLVAFSKAYVVKVKESANLLWSKKMIYTCECQQESSFFQKFFNIFKPQQGENSFNNLYDSYCNLCKKEYVQDKNFDILIECQEITLMISSQGELIKNFITVWAFGDFVNSLKEGNIVSFVAFYMPQTLTNIIEKDFEYGHFVALNFNLQFENLRILSEKNFLLEETNTLDQILERKEKTVGPSNNFSSKFNENLEIDILRSVKFQKQLITSINNLLFNNFIKYCENNLFSLSEDFSINGSYLDLAISLSLTQRDYLTKIEKILFFDDDKRFRQNSKNKIFDDNSEITNSRNLCFKSKIFQTGVNKMVEKQEKEIKKYFRLARIIKESENSNFLSNAGRDSLLRPLNLLFVLDDLTLCNPQVRFIYSQTKVHKSTVHIYPFFNLNRVSKESIINFFLTCNNGVVIIPDIENLSKVEIDCISSLMQNIYSNSGVGCDSKDSSIKLNICFWLMSSYSKIIGKKKNNSSFNLLSEVKNKIYKDLIEKCEIILNLSSKYNYTRGITEKSKENDNFENANFLRDFLLNYQNCEEYLEIHKKNNINKNINCLESSVKQQLNLLEIKLFKSIHDKSILSNIKICKEDHFYGTTNGEIFNDCFSSAKLMEDYFINKRNLSNVLFDDLFTIIMLDTFNSMLRTNLKNEKIHIPKTISNLNYTDVVIAIFYYEEYSVFKYGLDCSSFGNLIPKILYQINSKEFVDCVNELKFNAKSESDKTTPIPKAKNSLKKIMLEDFGVNSHIYRENDKSCFQCNRMLKLKNNEKLEDFIEKLTVFTYNN